MRDAISRTPVVVGAAIGVLGAVGTVIEGILGTAVGFHDFSTVQLRSILVGFCFVSFLLAPAVLAFVAGESVARTWSGFPLDMAIERGHGAVRRLSLRLTVALAIIAIVVYTLPIPFSYFLPHIFIYGTKPAIFWSMYLQMGLDLAWVVAFAISASELVRTLLGFKPLLLGQLLKSRYLLITACVFSAIGSMASYAMFVYPNIAYPIGGGSPRLVFVEFSDEFSGEWSSEDFSTPARLRRLMASRKGLTDFPESKREMVAEMYDRYAPRGSRGPFLLWRESGHYLFFTDPVETTGFMRSGRAVRRDHVDAIAETGALPVFLREDGMRMYDSWGLRANFIERKMDDILDIIRGFDAEAQSVDEAQVELEELVRPEDGSN